MNNWIDCLNQAGTGNNSQCVACLPDPTEQTTNPELVSSVVQSDCGQKATGRDDLREMDDESLARVLREINEKSSPITMDDTIHSRKKRKTCGVQKDGSSKYLIRCSTNKFNEMVDSMCQSRRELVRLYGFGRLLDVRGAEQNKLLVTTLISFFDANTCSFDFGTERIYMTSSDFEEIMGLPRGKENVSLNSKELHPSLRNRFCTRLWKRDVISTSTLETFLRDPNVDDVTYIMSFVLFSLLVLLRVPQRTDLGPRMLCTVADISKIKKLNWSKFCFQYLIDGLAHAKRSAATQPVVQGCTLFLQLFYLKWYCSRFKLGMGALKLIGIKSRKRRGNVLLAIDTEWTHNFLLEGKRELLSKGNGKQSVVSSDSSSKNEHTKIAGHNKLVLKKLSDLHESYKLYATAFQHFRAVQDRHSLAILEDTKFLKNAIEELRAGQEMLIQMLQNIGKCRSKEVEQIFESMLTALRDVKKSDAAAMGASEMGTSLFEKVLYAKGESSNVDGHKGAYFEKITGLPEPSRSTLHLFPLHAGD